MPRKTKNTIKKRKPRQKKKPVIKAKNKTSSKKASAKKTSSRMKKTLAKKTKKSAGKKIAVKNIRSIDHQTKPDLAEFDFQIKNKKVKTPTSTDILFLENLYNLGDAEIEEIEEIESQSNLNLKQKNIIMYVGITSIMLVIVGFWLMGVKNSFGNNLIKQNDDQQNLQTIWNQTQDNIKAVDNFIQENKQSINDFAQKYQQEAKQEQIKNKALDQVKQRLEQTKK